MMVDARNAHFSFKMMNDKIEITEETEKRLTKKERKIITKKKKKTKWWQFNGRLLRYLWLIVKRIYGKIIPGNFFGIYAFWMNHRTRRAYIDRTYLNLKKKNKEKKW